MFAEINMNGEENDEIKEGSEKNLTKDTCVLYKQTPL